MSLYTEIMHCRSNPLVFVSSRLEIDASDVVLVLPDLACQHVLLFVRCLLSPMKGNSRSHRNVLREFLHNLNRPFSNKTAKDEAEKNN